MPRKDELLNQLLATNKAPRGLLVEYIRLVCGDAKKLDLSDLLRVSGSGPFRESTTVGEKIARTIQHALLSQQNVNWEDDPALAHIEAIVTELTDKTDNSALWQELFDRVEKLEK